jgi:hypothetical protein
VAPTSLVSKQFISMPVSVLHKNVATSQKTSFIHIKVKTHLLVLT